MKLVLGGGNFHQKGWINVDYPFKKRAYKQNPSVIDVEHNFMSKRPLPFEDDSVDAVYTEHCIEHLTITAVCRLFDEVRRVLKPGHGFRISCPDADILVDRYLDKRVKDIGFSHKMKNEFKEVQLISALATPLINKVSTSYVKDLFQAYTREKAFILLMEQIGEVRSTDQAKFPGRHLSCWTFPRLSFFLGESFFRKIRRQGAHKSKLEVFAQSYFDNTQPAFSLIVQCAK